MNCLSLRWVVGSAKSMMERTFAYSGCTPELSILYPNHSISFWAILHFLREIAKFSLSSRCRQLLTSVICSVFVPLDAINMSSRKQKVLDKFMSVLSMAFWNSAGMSVSP